MSSSILRAAAVLFALSGATAIAYAEDPLTVFDANGVEVGRLGPGVTVHLTVNGQSYMVPLEGQRLGQNKLQSTRTLDFPSYNPYFRDEKCTGRPYLPFPGSFGVPLAFAEAKGATKVALRPAAAEARKFIMHSYRDRHGECHVPFDGEKHELWVEVLDPIDVTMLYARPFTVR